MKVSIKKINGLEFICRPGTSDEKTVTEVIQNDVYQKRGLKIESGEHWIDLGGNIGAFTVLALSKGATVTVYEPDPNSFQILQANIERNGFKAEVINKAVTANKNGHAFLNVSKTNQFWRNSLVKSWGGEAIKVDTVYFEDAIKAGDCVKMDIEGSEMPIIEKWNIEEVKKLVYEWSYDVDCNMKRHWMAIDNLKKYFQHLEGEWNRIGYENRNKEVWQKSWFPACTNVFCFNT